MKEINRLAEQPWISLNQRLHGEAAAKFKCCNYDDFANHGCWHVMLLRAMGEAKNWWDWGHKKLTS